MFDDDEKRVINGDRPFTKAKRSNCDVLDRNELQTYASLEKMFHKAIHVVRQLKKKRNTNTSSAPKQQSNSSSLSNCDLKTNVLSSDKSKAVKPTSKLILPGASNAIGLVIMLTSVKTRNRWSHPRRICFWSKGAVVWRLGAVKLVVLPVDVSFPGGGGSFSSVTAGPCLREVEASSALSSSVFSPGGEGSLSLASPALGVSSDEFSIGSMKLSEVKTKRGSEEIVSMEALR
ncbi:hypothetical protein YC2023_079375 [Brassica napus]